MITRLKPLTKKELDSTFFTYQFPAENSLIHSNLTIPGLLARLIRVNKRILEHTSFPFAFWGGMALYAYLFDIEMYDYNLIHFRTHNGKNDFDIGASITNISQIMNDFNWGRAEKITQTGRIRPGWEIIDLMVRESLPSFPSRKVEVKGNPIYLADPEEMLFQKLQSMATLNESWPGKSGEIKWAIDACLLKTYLAKILSLDKVKLEKYLKAKWIIYIKEKNNMSREKQYTIIDNIAKKIKDGMTPKAGIKEYFNIRFGGSNYGIKEQLTIVFGDKERGNIDSLVAAKTDSEFGEIFKKIIRDSYKNADYEEILEKAQDSYQSLLPIRYLDNYSTAEKLNIQLDQT